MKHLDKIANFAVIVGVAVFLVLVARSEFHHAGQDPRVLVGKKINLPELQFPLQRNSLVLALSTTCHFCESSLPFYKTLAAEMQGKVDLIAVLPQSESEGQKYVEHASLPARVISKNLMTLGVYGTPTVLLVDRTGKIQAEWQGLLDQKAQDEVIARATKG